MTKTEDIINIMTLSGIATDGLKLVARDDNDFHPIMSNWLDAYLNHEHDIEQEYLALLSDMVAVALKNQGKVIL